MVGHRDCDSNLRNMTLNSSQACMYIFISFYFSIQISSQYLIIFAINRTRCYFRHFKTLDRLSNNPIICAKDMTNCMACQCIIPTMDEISIFFFLLSIAFFFFFFFFFFHLLVVFHAPVVILDVSYNFVHSFPYKTS